LSEAPGSTATARLAQADVPLVLRALAAERSMDGMGVVLVEGDAVVIAQRAAARMAGRGGRSQSRASAAAVAFLGVDRLVGRSAAELRRRC
jgi:hypothetical protein